VSLAPLGTFARPAQSASVAAPTLGAAWPRVPGTTPKLVTGSFSLCAQLRQLGSAPAAVAPLHTPTPSWAAAGLTPVTGRVVRAQAVSTSSGWEAFTLACAQRSLAGRVLASAWQRHANQQRLAGSVPPQAGAYFDTPATQLTAARSTPAVGRPVAGPAHVSMGATPAGIGVAVTTAPLTYVQAEPA
jgi:hypothetical protein